MPKLAGPAITAAGGPVSGSRKLQRKAYEAGAHPTGRDHRIRQASGRQRPRARQRGVSGRAQVLGKAARIGI